MINTNYEWRRPNETEAKNQLEKALERLSRMNDDEFRELESKVFEKVKEQGRNRESPDPKFIHIHQVRANIQDIYDDNPQVFNNDPNQRRLLTLCALVHDLRKRPGSFGNLAEHAYAGAKDIKRFFKEDVGMEDCDDLSGFISKVTEVHSGNQPFIEKNLISSLNALQKEVTQSVLSDVLQDLREKGLGDSADNFSRALSSKYPDYYSIFLDIADTYPEYRCLLKDELDKRMPALETSESNRVVVEYGLPAPFDKISEAVLAADTESNYGLIDVGLEVPSGEDPLEWRYGGYIKIVLLGQGSVADRVGSIVDSGQDAISSGMYDSFPATREAAVESCARSRWLKSLFEEDGRFQYANSLGTDYDEAIETHKRIFAVALREREQGTVSTATASSGLLAHSQVQSYRDGLVKGVKDALEYMEEYYGES